jgi:hypothetical protein
MNEERKEKIMQRPRQKINKKPLKPLQTLCKKCRGKCKWELNPGCPHRNLACYILSYCGQRERLRFSKTYQLIANTMENIIVYCRGTAEC